MERIPNILFIGGAGTGKSEAIKKLWDKKPTSNSLLVASDDIPGRGMMKFSVIEMPPVVYSFRNYAPKGTWFTGNVMELLADTDAIIFVLPAKSYGYEKEFLFLKELLNHLPSSKNIPINVAISKIEELRPCKGGSYKEVIPAILELERYIYRLIEKYGLEGAISIDNIIPFSASKDLNLSCLKETIWESVISHTNDMIFDPAIPTVVVSGKRGCGKSSTLNVLFGLDLPIDKAVACTKYPRVLIGNLEGNGLSCKINIVDLPGISENIKADMNYYPFYRKYVERATILLCMNQANVRAYKQDEQFYGELENSGSLKGSTAIIIAMNHCDSLFKDEQHLDGVDLNTLSLDNDILKAKIDDMFENNYRRYFKITHPNLSRDNVVPISAVNNWNIDTLKDLILSNIKNN